VFDSPLLSIIQVKGRLLFLINYLDLLV